MAGWELISLHYCIAKEYLKRLTFSCTTDIFSYKSYFDIFRCYCLSKDILTDENNCIIIQRKPVNEFVSKIYLYYR